MRHRIPQNAAGDIQQIQTLLAPPTSVAGPAGSEYSLNATSSRLATPSAPSYWSSRIQGNSSYSDYGAHSSQTYLGSSETRSIRGPPSEAGRSPSELAPEMGSFGFMVQHPSEQPPLAVTAFVPPFEDLCPSPGPTYFGNTDPELPSNTMSPEYDPNIPFFYYDRADDHQY